MFLDRDGVINRQVPDPVDGRPESPIRANDVSWLRAP
jgi:histidinol phosphatase-like enzyme